jgi:phosphoribosylamine--glycine ligase
MIDAHGEPKTLEFNTRMGDPETQPILMRLKSDLVEVLLRATDGHLDQIELQWDRRVALGVVMAAAGYPADPRKGDLIKDLTTPTGSVEAKEDVVIFHAGTELRGGRLLTSGGRVLCVTALGETVRAARQRAYDELQDITFDGAQWRTDIGHRALIKR